MLTIRKCEFSNCASLLRCDFCIDLHDDVGRTTKCTISGLFGIWRCTCSGGIERVSSYCETETFNATCPTDHVVLMTHARYGRMQVSRCVKMDYGHIGCADDVIEAADWRCSGRRRCKVRVPDAEFAKNKPCPDDLKPYLEAAYVCVRGNSHRRNKC